MRFNVPLQRRNFISLLRFRLSKQRNFANFLHQPKKVYVYENNAPTTQHKIPSEVDELKMDRAKERARTSTLDDIPQILPKWRLWRSGRRIKKLNFNRCLTLEETRGWQWESARLSCCNFYDWYWWKCELTSKVIARCARGWCYCRCLGQQRNFVLCTCNKVTIWCFQ